MEVICEKKRHSKGLREKGGEKEKKGNGMKKGGKKTHRVTGAIVQLTDLLRHPVM